MFTIIKQIRALLKIKGELKNMKMSELQTSEGRLTILTNILGIWSALHGFIPAPLMAKLTVVSVGIYAIARSALKIAEVIAGMTKNVKDDAVVAEAKVIVDKIEGK